MKRSWIIGSVVTGHIAAVFLLLMQGCQTDQGSKRTVLIGPHTEGTAVVQPPLVTGTATVSPDGRAIPPVSTVGKRGTFTEVVVPKTPAAQPRQPRPVAVKPKMAPPPIPAAASTYTVAKGDTLGHIAQRHGVSARDLIRLNNINEPNKLLVGQKIKIPAAGSQAQKATGTSKAVPAGATTHKVVAGDSVSVIAQKYGVRTADVLAANQLTGTSVIRVGQTLVIPGAEKAKPVATARPATPPAQKKVETAVATETRTAVASPVESVKPVTLPAPVTAADAGGAVEAPKPADSDAAAATAEPEYRTYVVQENEDVYTLAVKWSISPTELRQLNNLTTSELTPGQTIRVPK